MRSPTTRNAADDPLSRLSLVRTQDPTLSGGIAAGLSSRAADREACPDVEVFAQGVRGALDDLARSVLMPAP